MNSKTLRELLDRLLRGEFGVESVVERLESMNGPLTAATSDAHVDLDRQRRCGYPEVVFCEGKTAEGVVEIFEALVRHKQDCLATRVSPKQAEALLERFPNACYHAVARTVRLPKSSAAAAFGKVAVITAGTSDRPVAEEAVETLRWMGCGVELIVDVGVAGPHRLHEQRDRFEDADAVVVIAGMEGALPSMVGGCVDCPVIAVPTSIGYGASFGGVAALLGMLNSCASNVTVVNIDSGFKGGYVAGLIAQRTNKSKSPTSVFPPDSRSPTPDP
jgi:NCAIR mutase (PurE)-related protein